MNKKILTVTLLVSLLIVVLASAKETAAEKEAKKQQRMEEVLRSLPDSVFEDVKLEDLLDDEVYLKLAKDGWSSREITTIMETAVRDKQKARQRDSYGAYAKLWRPAFGRVMSDDPLYQVKDSTLTLQSIATIIDAVGENNYNATWPIKDYDPTDRKTDVNYNPDRGYFRPVLLHPSSGRIHWIVVNQNDPDGNQLYAVPDGAGIYSTDDCGKSWTCITDNIPDRAYRANSPGYAIPVDPLNWKHLFAFMNGETVYETEDGGRTWTRVIGATHKTFKRGYAFRDGQGTLKLIGASMAGNRMKNQLWLSTDKGVNWKELKPDEAHLETANGTTGFWFQQMAFDLDNHDVVYFPGSYSILYFDDGGHSGNLKRLSFKLYGKDKKTVRYEQTECFPFYGDGPGFLEIDPNNSDRMWYAVGNSTNYRSAIYFSDDHGKSWITLNEPATDANNRRDADTFTESVGSGAVFGNEVPKAWLGGFGIRYNSDDPDEVPQMLFGCSMSSAYSTDGGRNWTEYAWGIRQCSYLEDLPNMVAEKGYFHVSASRHNADNHCIASHKSGRVFRGSDGGFFFNDPQKVKGTPRYSNNATTVSYLNDYDWFNISSNLGQMLFYNVRVNEFGDQAIIGNTQDIDVQTYRYGRWGHWRGYEGTESSFNPYTNTGYFSGGGAGPEGMNADSWHSARNYADVVTGDWFMLRTWNGGNSPSTLYRVENIGRSLTDLYPAINKTVTDVALARDKGRLTVFARTNDNALWISTDSCQTFKPVMSNNGQAKFVNSHIAADPDNSDYLYIGQNNGKVMKYNIADGTFPTVGEGLPTSLKCSRIFFHEGSGDLYYVDYDSGIYILKNGETKWKFWTKGYNGSKFTDCDINYTTQEFVIADFGRGVWVADLETPSDRYFDSFDKVDANPKRVLKVKEISHRDGRRVFGIDTEWTIPMYYNYKWTIDGNDVKNPYQYLNIDDTKYAQGFTVQLELSLREAPYIKTISAPLTVAASESVPMERRQGNALYSNGEGRVDIGYMDWFYSNFSVDLWIKPMSDGVILANMAKDVSRGAKGWMLYIEGGVLKFKYYPFNQFDQPTYEAGLAQNDVVSGSAIVMNKWSHVAVTSTKQGQICLYINGEQVASKNQIRNDEDYTLNNSVIMSLFGDAFESSTLKASVDELKFWRKALTLDEVRREMFSTDIAEPGYMVAHYDFNGEKLADNTETFTGYKPLSRSRAVTSPERMTVPVNANYVATGTLSKNNAFKSANGSMPLLDINNTNATGVPAVVYGYLAERWNNPDDNLSEEYYIPTEYGYMIRTFGAVTPESTADITFHNGSGQFNADKKYRLYTADNSEDRMYWKQFGGDLQHDENGNLKLEGVTLNDITDRKLLIVSMNPAIEMEIHDLSPDGRIVLYDDGEDKTEFRYTARLIEGMTVPNNKYEIMSDSSIIEIPNPVLSFTNENISIGRFKVDTDLIGPFNNTVSTYIRGKDDNLMIPIPVDILNRISPRTLDYSVQISGGGMKVGTAADFAALTGTRNLTIMGWVRIDSETMMNNGRNGDGVSPLLFFRTSPSNAGTTGIHLRRHTTNGVFDGAMLGYHWNDVAWNYNAETPFIIPKEDIGKWNHVALVVNPDGAWMYFNGMEYKMKGTPAGGMPECTVQSPLLVGMNIQGGNTYFNGAFDHVAVWNRSLAREEIHKYMHNRVLLNDQNLLAYMTMDETDDKGRIKESLKGMTSVYYGTVNPGSATPVPFAPYRQDMDMTSADSPIKLSTHATGCVATFEGTPYNFIAAGDPAQQSLPLNNEFYTLIFAGKPATTTDDITLTFSNDGLVDGDKIALGIRKMGSVTPFTDLIESISVTGKKATFTVPANRLDESSEIMFFTTPETQARPTIVRMAFDNSDVHNGDVYLVTDGKNEINIDVNVISSAKDAAVGINAVEPYVSLSTNTINLGDADQKVRMTIDLAQLRRSDESKFGLSDVTVNLNGTEAEPLTLKVGLQPKVELNLLNGEDATHYVATSAVSTLDIEARLTEGYLTENIGLKVTPDNLQSALNISNGTLLLNSSVTISGLNDATVSETPDAPETTGWNLIGNPYLANINLTKHQNYGDIEDNVAHFVYQRLDGSDNIVAYDMTDYDASHQINPFEPFYIQTLNGNDSFTVTHVAKERSLDRKTFDNLTENDHRYVTLSLCDETGKEVDRTTIHWADNADQGYVLDEDAPKVQPANTSANSLYTFTEDGVRSSINFVPDEVSNIVIPVGIHVVNTGTMKFKVLAINGFADEDDEDDTLARLVLADCPNGYSEGSGTRKYLTGGTEYEFTINDAGSTNRRFVIVPIFDEFTSIDDILKENNAYLYNVYNRQHSLTVDGMQGDAEIAVFNTAGVQILFVHTSDSSYTASLDSGVYIVRIRENENVYTTKVVVK